MLTADATDLGISRNVSNALETELTYPRAVTAVAARASGILALDTPHVHIANNEQSLHAECDGVKQMGFKGKFAVHPNQIERINHTFGFTREQIDYAQKVVAAFDDSVRLHGRASIHLDGRMVDIPVYKRCENILRMSHLQNLRKK